VSDGPKIPFADALVIAERLVGDLKPVCRRVKVAGSLRRRKPLVGDIELVCEPVQQPPDLFGEVHADTEAVRRVCAQWGEILKGGDRYIQVQGHPLKIDVFMVSEPADWYVILAIRTGPADLGKWAVTQMHGTGHRCEDGRIIHKASGRRVECESEADFFRYAALDYYPPAQRDGPDAMKPRVIT
jgi:DNA polymerase/3'-5' exonuclease PolX